MRHFIVTIILIVLPYEVLNCQKNVTIYYDSLWGLTTKDLAEYFRIATIDTTNYKFEGKVSDYYKDGNLQMEGKYVFNNKIDTFIFYYPDGKLRTIGFYQNNKRYGIWINYYENGGIKEKLVFNNDFLCPIDYYDKNGSSIIINGTGEWETQYLYNSDFDSITVKGAYKDTLRNGTWNYYIKNLLPNQSHDLRLACTESYKDGRFTEGKYYWSQGSVQILTSPKIIILPESSKFKKTENWSYTKYASRDEYPFLKFLPKVDSAVFPVDQYAMFQGGMDSLKEVIVKRMKLPKSYLLSRPKTFCLFTIRIEETGQLLITEDPNIHAMALYPDAKIFYDHALKALNDMPVWIPAKRANKNVKSYYYISLGIDNRKINVSLLNLNAKRK